MHTKRFAVAAFVAGQLVAATVVASAAGAMSPTVAGPVKRPPVTTLACAELHATIAGLNSWLDAHDSYNHSGDTAKQQDYNDHFDMMASMQVQGRNAGCYNAVGAPIT